MHTVAIIQREIPHYRIRFFEELYAQGKSQGFEIQIYTAVLAKHTGKPAFPYRILPVLKFGKDEVTSMWMRGLESSICGSDIVVAPQELQCLNVPYLWAKRKRLCTTWIWWGHGYNFQASMQPSLSTTIKEAIKRYMTRQAAGLITYTAKGAEYWRQNGLSQYRAIPYYNTIDVEGIRATATEISDLQLLRLRNQLDIEGKHVLLFSGRLHSDKQVSLLIRTFAYLKKEQYPVALLIMGDGAERQNLEQLRDDLKLTDVHFIGECTDVRDSSMYFKVADILIIPALVGLAIVHGFAFGLPIITTTAPGHGPEIEYLEGDAGVITCPCVSSMASAVASILRSENRLKSMKQAAMNKGSQLRLSCSVQRFMDGIRRFASPTS